MSDLIKYQKDPQCGPDKASEWQLAVQDDSWVLSHQSLRGELRELSQAIQFVLASMLSNENTESPASWKIASLQSIYNYHKEHVLAHHKSEEEILVPFCETRFVYPDKASDGHKGLEQTLDSLSQALESIVDKNTLKVFHDSFETYSKDLGQHLDAEEETVLPLIRAYFTQDEFKETGKRMGREGGHAGSFVYYMGEDYFRNQFMPNHNIPSFVWYVAFSKAQKEYQHGVIRHVKALETNEPLPEENCVVS